MISKENFYNSFVQRFAKTLLHVSQNIILLGLLISNLQNSWSYIEKTALISILNLIPKDGPFKPMVYIEEPNFL